jgi:hypothetical protein
MGIAIRGALGVALGCFWIVGAAGAQSAAAATPQERAVLVELFTSEGCSSCPPADALLQRLNGVRVEPGVLIVALSEHVTYWNRLGWIDPFSQEQFTQRQSAYGERFQLDSVYTPQVVVNGEHQVLGSDGRAILGAVSARDQTMPVTVRILEAQRSNGALLVTYTSEGKLPGAELFAVVADDLDTSTVPRGENAGRTLTHVAVARSLRRVGPLGQAGTQSFTLALPTQPKGHGEAALHLVLFAQAPGLGRVLSVDSRGF